jgi:hypothetical protein
VSVWIRDKKRDGREEEKRGKKDVQLLEKVYPSKYNWLLNSN